ncbi:glycine cleavage system aminomethyltransferase GcvT [Spirulina major CS-329]|nr:MULTISPECIES: glycine cleavage system aminomethyltransferase GcvT [Spirulina]MDB9496173.1 glycine cleavage system aminomethyltransferase GcvT [Spirulina subsalsa CS-330]MDB9501605.1 glycine cleavage system aminomethyltransferase GcvT [Spirulina major CS-329]
MQSSDQLSRTPLFDLMAAQNARFTAFAGWEMPVQFTGLKQEHEAVRTQVGMFDISHMGKFLWQGREARQQLQRLVPSDLGRLEPGLAQYTVLLNPDGGIIDDVIVYYQGMTAGGEEQGVIIVNAATRSQDYAWITEHLSGSPVTLEDVSADRVLIAVQGPEAIATLQPLIKADLTAIPSFGHCQTEILDGAAFIARTGYTGEDGFEVMVDIPTGQALWQALAAAGVAPCGLGARDTLRLEAAMALYGQDITEKTTPLEAGLAWLVHLDSNPDFIGRDVLAAQKAAGVERRLVGLEMAGRHIARHDYPVVVAGETVGVVTSGTLSPTLGKAIALAYVPKALTKPGNTVNVEIRGKSYPATVVKKPFYRSPHRS